MIKHKANEWAAIGSETSHIKSEAEEVAYHLAASGGGYSGWLNSYKFRGITSMVQFIAFAPGVEVNGQTVLSVVEGMSMVKKLAREILENNGLVNVQPERWYSQQGWLDSFKAIASRVGGKEKFQVNIAIFKLADLFELF